MHTICIILNSVRIIWFGAGAHPSGADGRVRAQVPNSHCASVGTAGAFFNFHNLEPPKLPWLQFVVYSICTGLVCFIVNLLVVHQKHRHLLERPIWGSIQVHQIVHFCDWGGAPGRWLPSLFVELWWQVPMSPWWDPCWKPGCVCCVTFLRKTRHWWAVLDLILKETIRQ